MKRKLTYTNMRNQTIVLNEYPFYSSLSDLRDWKWEYESENHVLTNFARGKTERTLKVSIVNESLSARENLFSVFETDTVLGAEGSLKLGDWELGCRAVESTKTNSGDLDFNFEFKLVSQSPGWRRETLYSIDTTRNPEVQENAGRDYLRFYNWGYTKPNANSQNIKVTNPGGAGFILRFYGPVVNPIVYINNNPYQVNVQVGASQQLIVTSIGKTKTIYLKSASGTETNEFSKRSKDFSVFTNLDYGTNILAYNSGSRFDLTVVEERSEPKWN